MCIEIKKIKKDLKKRVIIPLIKYKIKYKKKIFL